MDESGDSRAQLATYIARRISEFNEVPADRRTDLAELALYVGGRLAAGKPPQLVFICTHNSRRSHLSQIWAAVAANHYGVAPVACFSGGTEATAFHPRAVAALERAGLAIGKSADQTNPLYTVAVGGGESLVCFSKKFGDPPNPTADFGAVMTCSSADHNCPVVPGAAARFAIPYDDPQAADGTPEETATYDARCAQIAREMLYLMSRVGR